METYIYALFIDGEARYEERKEIMSTNDPLFPFLKNCMYGPKVNFIKEDGSCSFGIQLIDYGFIINKNKTVLPLLPGSIIEGPIKKMNLENTQQIIYLDKQSNIASEQGADECTYNDLCQSMNEEKSFGMIGDDMMLQQEDIELEEEIVCLHTSEAGSLSPLAQEIQSEAMQKSDKKTMLRNNQQSISFSFEEAQESKGSEKEDEEDQVKSILKKKASRSFDLKKKKKMKINRDIKDVANALVNFSSINDRMILEKNKEEMHVENEEVQDEKITKFKNNRNIKGSKLRKQGRRPSKLNITGAEQLDIQYSETEIAEQLSVETIDSNIVIKSPEKFQYNEQINSNLLNSIIQQLDIVSNIVTQAPEDFQFNAQKVLNRSNISESNVDESQSDFTSSVKENPDCPIYILNKIALLENKIEDQSMYNAPLFSLSNIHTDDIKIVDTIADEKILDNHEQTENIQPNMSQFSELKDKTSDESHSIFDDLILSNQRAAQIEGENTVDDEVKIEAEIKVLGLILPVSSCIVNKVVKVESVLDELRSSELLTGSDSNFPGRFIYALHNPNKKKYIETSALDSVELMQRLKVMEEERKEMRDEIRQEQMRLQQLEQDLEKREKNARRKRTYKKVFKDIFKDHP